MCAPLRSAFLSSQLACALNTHVQGDGQISVKSAMGLARAMASHPDAIGPILKQLTVKPKN